MRKVTQVKRVHFTRHRWHTIFTYVVDAYAVRIWVCFVEIYLSIRSTLECDSPYLIPLARAQAPGLGVVHCMCMCVDIKACVMIWSHQQNIRRQLERVNLVLAVRIESWTLISVIIQALVHDCVDMPKLIRPFKFHRRRICHNLYSLPSKSIPLERKDRIG